MINRGCKGPRFPWGQRVATPLYTRSAAVGVVGLRVGRHHARRSERIQPAWCHGCGDRSATPSFHPPSCRHRRRSGPPAGPAEPSARPCWHDRPAITARRALADDVPLALGGRIRPLAHFCRVELSTWCPPCRGAAAPSWALVSWSASFNVWGAPHGG